MSSFKFTLCVIAALLTIVAVVNSQTNCGVGSAACDRCGANSTILQVNGRGIKVCCKSCSGYYRAGYRDTARRVGPYCSCTYDKVGGDCWKGDICKTCGHGYVGRINGLPVCCQNCERSGLYLSPTKCNCLHNGP